MKEQITIPLSKYEKLLTLTSDLNLQFEQLTLQNQELSEEILPNYEKLLGEYEELNIKYTKLVADNEKLTSENAALKETVLHLRNQII